MYEGHLPDGSSIQRHSAGELYPYVIICRGADTLEWGFIGPDTNGPIWTGGSKKTQLTAEIYKHRYDARQAEAAARARCGTAKLLTAAAAVADRITAHNQREWSRFAAQRR